MAKKKAQKKTAKKSTKKTTKAGLQPVHIVLCVLVIGLSFYTGYLVGSQPDTAGTVKTGTAGMDKLTVIEYSDFQCPFCTRAIPTVKDIKKNYDNVEVVYKHFPLESIHPNAFNAAVASECVRNEGGDDAFWTYHDTLFANQGTLEVANLKSYATAQGIDISSCLDNQETAAVVRADMDEARSRGVSGTPSFWIHDELLVGAQPYATISAKIDEKLSGNTAQAPAAPSAPEPAAKVDMDPGNYILGDANAPVEIVEFSDMQCPFCKRAHDQSFPSLKSTYIDTGKVSYSVRHFPLPMHNDAQKAGEATECAGKLGGSDAFYTYMDSLFTNQGSLDVASLKSYAKDQGLDASAFDSCLDSGEFATVVQNDMSVGQTAGVRGTPSFFINGQILVGAQPFTSFQTIIDAELS